MNWRPEEEVDEDEKKQALRLMRRDEAMAIVMTMIESQIGQKVPLEAATDAAIKQAPKVMAYLDDGFEV